MLKHIILHERTLENEVRQEIGTEARTRQQEEERMPPPTECVPGREHRFRESEYRNSNGRPQQVMCDHCGCITRNPGNYQLVEWNDYV